MTGTDDRDAPAELTIQEADRIDFAGGSVTVSFPGSRLPLRLFLRDEGRNLGEVGYDGMRVSFSGEPFGVVRPAGQAPDAAALHVDLDHRATATAVQALIENLVLTDVSGGLAARTALVTVAERHGRTHTVYFGLRPVEPPAPHRASAPRPPALTSGFQADVDSDSFVFAVPAKA